MMHAYVAEDFDAQTGVFSMFNPAIWPLSTADEVAVVVLAGIAVIEIFLRLRERSLWRQPHDIDGYRWCGRGGNNCIVRLSVPAPDRRDAQEVSTQTKTDYKIIRQFREASEKSGYQVEKLMKLV